MDFKDIAFARLYNHKLSNPTFTDPVDVVRYLGAVQAQDYVGGLLSIGMRMKSATETQVEQSIIDRKIVRTWPMRGTLHLVPAEDTKWMQELLAARVIRRMQSYYRKAELDDAVFRKCEQLTIDALQGGKTLTREELYKVWNASGIETKAMRGLFILGHLAHMQLICHGARSGKQQTLVLLDEWVSHSRKLSREESLAELALRYFTSHGPAQMQDFLWWTGLTLAEGKEAVNSLGGKIISEVINDKVYFMSPDLKFSKDPEHTAYLLQAYDEFTVAYKDRDAIFNPSNADKIKAGINFTSVFILDSQVVGFWKRTIKKDSIVIRLDPLYKFTTQQFTAVREAGESYGKFLVQPVEFI